MTTTVDSAATAAPVRMPNHWVITKDYNPDVDAQTGTNVNAVGVTSRGCPADRSALTLRFRLVDGDHEVNYEGLMVPFALHNEHSYGFEPLDDFGEPNAGCTYLEYFENGTWQPL